MSEKDKLWTPKKIGKIVAERKLILSVTGKKPTSISVQFGAPIRKLKAKENDPWICPFKIKGIKPDYESNVFGIDSLQALTIALELVDKILPSIGQEKGGQIIYLDRRAPLIFNKWPDEMEKEMDLKLEEHANSRKRSRKKTALNKMK